MSAKMEPLVSIITPSYNSANFIGATIESVLNQTYKNFEMIIVDDLSTDNTEQIVKKYLKNDKRIKFFSLPKKGGASEARNKAISEAKGKYIAFLDSDDIWKKEKLENQISFMENNNIDFSYTDYEYIDEQGKNIGKIRVCPKKISYFRMLLGDSIGCLTVVYNAEKVGKIAIPKLKKRNDYALWCKALKKVKKGYKLNEILASYRKVSSSISSGSKVGLLKFHYQMHREVNKFNPIVASFFTCTNILVYFANKIFRDKEVNFEKNKYKIGIVGHFADLLPIYDGQTVKTRNLYNELKKIYGNENITYVDTYKWKKNPFKLLTSCLKAIKNSENIVILPASNGIKVFAPLFVFLNKIFKKKIYYAVVGGWLPDFLVSNKKMIKSLEKFNCIFVETNGMKQRLNDLGLKNIDILLNFKDLEIEKFLKWNNRLPYKVCTFSRVIKETAINCVKKINEKYKKTIYCLDIYGPIGKEYELEFEKILKELPSYIKYKGIVDSSKSVETLKKYSFLLFPTFYSGEGLAGTIIDAYFAGIPVIASDWKYNKEIILNNCTGFLYEVHKDEQLIKILEDVYKGKYNINEIKKNCIEEARNYLPENAIINLIKYIE